MSADDDIETPVVERRMLVEDTKADSVDKLIPHLSSLTTQSMVVPTPSIRNITMEEGDMSQSYHEIFDTQGYLTQDSPVSVTTPGTETGSGSVDSGHTETGGGGVHDGIVYYNEGDGSIVSCSPPAATPMSTYLTTKLVADSIMWQQTFRNDSPSPDELQQPATSVPNDPDCAARPRPSSLGSDLPSSLPSPRDMVVDPMVLNDIEKEARLLATDVDSLVENLSCVLQSVSGLTVETVQTYRDGVCKTCEEVDSNIRAMYQLMAKWEELNKNMAPAYRVSSQIKDIKRLLDMFEAALG